MSQNRSSVSHTIRDTGYKYDIFKGELCKGSMISKSTHPCPEVEEFKRRLAQRKLLKDLGTHWVLKKNIRTGLLMALNLYTGRLMKESPHKQDIIVTPLEAAELKDKLQEKQICTTDSEIVMKSIRDTLRFSCVNIMEVNADVFTHHGADTFGKDEAFVLKILQEKGIVSKSARHGSTSEKEADIVDEIRGEQYEITYEFKTELSKKKMKPDFIYSPEILMVQLVDNPYIHTSKSLGKKLDKEYSDRYRPNLVILTLGTPQAVTTMLESLGEKLKREQKTNINFSNIYIISLDFIAEQALLARISPTESFISDRFPCKNDELGFIKLTPVEFSSMKDSHKYLMVCDGIFDEVPRCRYDEGKELKAWAKEIRIWGTR